MRNITAQAKSGNGKLDLAVPKSTPSPFLSVLLGNGDGTFGARNDFPTLDLPVIVVAGDFNNDGKLDLAVNGQSGGVSVLLGNGDGTFAAHKDTSTGSDPGLTTSVSHATGDFNNDGKLDLVLGNIIMSPGTPGALPASVLVLLLGNGDGTFNVQPLFPVTLNSALGIATGDFNRDGTLDLAVTRSSDAKLTTFLGNGDGTFGTATDFGTGLGPYFVVAKDFNGDGKLDLAIANRDSGSITILLNTSK